MKFNKVGLCVLNKDIFTIDLRPIDLKTIELIVDRSDISLNWDKCESYLGLILYTPFDLKDNFEDRVITIRDKQIILHKAK